ncbi:NAD(P)-dependent oxidoreductase [Stappia sp. P2PMeth1]|uniref:NAD-dependent epimerase/dehydratase family protein n=1 Tax=Stappia sp. P2PMeth1 TaxID=2003586 RepID=UPI001645195A|nr:NAD(P)-dependent oxidoreductase [Stappia sp. P2PMeth1]
MILVTGASGYLGTHVLSELRRAGYQAVGLSRREVPGMEMCDLQDAPQLARLMDRMRPDKVIHCAWETPQSLTEYQDDTAATRGLAMVDNLLAATQAPILYVSSMTVYGSQNPFVARREEDAGQPESAYGRAKWAAEQRLRGSGRAGFAVRLPGLFGGGRCNGLIWNLLSALMRGDRLKLPRQPLLWAAMDVRDAARAFPTLCDAPLRSAVPINIGYNDVYSISRLVALLGELTGRAAICDTPHPDFAFDLTRAHALGVDIRQNLRGACHKLMKEVA